MINKINLSFFGTSLGYSISLFLIPILLLKITNSALMVSISYALDVIPYILLTPFIGVLGDKYNKKNFILFGESVCFFISIIIIITPYEEKYSIILILLGFFISTFSALHHPIFQSILPEIYTKKELIKVNSDIAAVSSLTGIIAPSIIAIAFSFVNERSIVAIMILCYFISMTTFYFIPHTPPRIKDGKGIVEGLKESWVFLENHHQLKHLSYLFFFANFGLKLVFVSLIWIYSTKFSLNNTDIAINFIIIGVLSILGSKIAGKYIVGKYNDKNIIILSLIIIALITLSINLIHSPIYLTLAWGSVSFLSMFIVVTYFTYRQEVTPQGILGKIISITRLISYLAIPPASILSGYLMNHYKNENIIYSISGISMLFFSIIFFYIMKKDSAT